MMQCSSNFSQFRVLRLFAKTFCATIIILITSANISRENLNSDRAEVVRGEARREDSLASAREGRSTESAGLDLGPVL